MIRGEGAKAAGTAAKAKAVLGANAGLLGGRRRGKKHPRRGRETYRRLSLLVVFPLLLFGLASRLAKHDLAPSWHDNHLYTAPAAGSQETPVLRDDRGRIVRSPGARAAFERRYPCPSTGRGDGSCPGFIIDHIEPLACGGADQPFNMQWQSLAAASAKDKTELSCRQR